MLTRKIGSLIRGKASPMQIMLACVLGAMFGFAGSFSGAPGLWLALVISVGAQLLLYRLIRAGDLVDVTSLFYLVPVGTAVLDLLIFNTVPAPLALAGMGAILGGLALVLRKPQPAPRA